MTRGKTLTGKPVPEAFPRLSSPSSQKSAPPLQFRTHGSSAYALLSFCLHLLALAALFGSFAHVIYFLVNRILVAGLTSQTEADLMLASQSVVGFIALLVALVTVALLVRNAIRVHRDACKQLQIGWYDEGHIRVHLDKAVASLPLSSNEWHQCVLANGCYSTHWAVVLALHPGDSDQAQPTGGRFCILIMRDAVSEETFRHLRLWMHLVAPSQLARSNGV